MIILGLSDQEPTSCLTSTDGIFALLFFCLSFVVSVQVIPFMYVAWKVASSVECLQTCELELNLQTHINMPGVVACTYNLIREKAHLLVSLA